MGFLWEIAHGLEDTFQGDSTFVLGGLEVPTYRSDGGTEEDLQQIHLLFGHAELEGIAGLADHVAGEAADLGLEVVIDVDVLGDGLFDDEFGGLFHYDSTFAVASRNCCQSLPGCVMAR